MNRLIMIDGHCSVIIISCGLLCGWDSVSALWLLVKKSVKSYNHCDVFSDKKPFFCVYLKFVSHVTECADILLASEHLFQPGKTHVTSHCSWNQKQNEICCWIFCFTVCWAAVLVDLGARTFLMVLTDTLPTESILALWLSNRALNQ